jgi:hypothetical protein
MLSLLLACAPRPVEVPVAAAPAPEEEALDGLVLELRGLGACRRFVMSVEDYGEHGEVIVERDPDSEKVDCRAKASWVGWPSGRVSLDVDTDGSAATDALYGAEYVKHQQVLLEDPTGDLGWVIDAGSLERSRPPGRSPDPAVSLEERLFVVFEVTVQGSRPDDVSALHPQADVSPSESWRRDDFDYCREYVNPRVFRAGELSLRERVRSEAYPVDDLRVWCSRTHGNVFAVELRGLERQPIDVRLDIANAPRLVRLNLSEFDTLAIVDITVEAGAD